METIAVGLLDQLRQGHKLPSRHVGIVDEKTVRKDRLQCLLFGKKFQTAMRGIDNVRKQNDGRLAYDAQRPGIDVFDMEIAFRRCLSAIRWPMRHAVPGKTPPFAP